MRWLMALTLLAVLVSAPTASAHRLNWLPVREYALDVVQATLDETPDATRGGIAARCWRWSNHDVGCPTFILIDHVDESGNTRHLRCTGYVEAIAAHSALEFVRWIVPDMSCNEIGPPPPPPPGFG